MKRFLTLLFLSLVALVAVGCDLDKDNDKDDKFTATAIKTVLQDANNNDEISIEGVVFGVVNNGFYVADANDSSIFVLTGTASSVEVVVGDKVQVTGQFNVANNFPQVRNVTIEVVDSGLTSPIEVTDGTVADIAGLDSTDRVNSYARIYRIDAMLGQNVARMYTLSDDQGRRIIVSPSSNVSLLEQHLDKQVTITVIVHNYLVGEGAWNVSFAGGASDIVEIPYDFDAVVESALTHLESVVPSTFQGVLTLPIAHPVMASVKYIWSVENNSHLSIGVDGKININLDTVDHKLTFTVTITDGTNESKKDFEITSKGIVEQSVSELLTNLPEISLSYIHVRGVVVGIARNQSLSLRSLILQDPTTLETTAVDFSNTGSYILNTSDEFKAISVGDEVSIKARYRLTGRQTVMNVSEVKIISSDNEYTHDFDNAYVLKDKESYQYFGENYTQFNNKLVKFEKPHLNFSTSATPTDTNWVILGHDENSGTLGFGGTSGSRRLGLLIAAQNESLGDTSWYTLLNIPFVNQPGMQIEGDIYAYAIYVSASYVAFVIPDWSAWVFESHLSVERDLGLNIPSTTEGGVIDFLTEHELATGDIKWTSSNESIINTTTGVIKSVNEVTVVTLTAEYVYKDQTYTTEFMVTILPSTILTVSQVLADVPNGIAVKVKGVVAGYSSDGNNNATRDGIILLDNETGEMLLINGLASVHAESSYGNYFDSDGNLLSIGDEVILNGTYFTSASAVGSGPVQTNRRHIVVNSETIVQRTTTESELNFKYEDAIVIDSHEAQLAFAEDFKYATLLKFVGTEETPFFIGGSTSNSSNPLNVKIFFNEATSNDGTKYNGLTFSLKTDVNAPNAGAYWQEELFGITENFVGPTSTNPRIPIIGEIYVVVTSITSTYAQMSIVDVKSATVQRLVTE